MNDELDCDGMCVTAADLGVGRADQVAYPHPGCPAHAPAQTCDCGQPDTCLSPTHGEITMTDALKIRHAQKPENQS